MKGAIFLVLIVLLQTGAFGRPSDKNDYKENGGKKERVCGYEGCPQPKPNMINVHMVPHTHDDVGWLKTVDQYYYGSKTLIQKAGVQYIIDSFIQELLNDPEKRFIYVESAFFSKWWSNQTPELQKQVQQLVNEGRLEFIGGAWSMNDEAASHYNSVIDQFTWGLKFLKDNFGECGRPRIGWQIDPFGHSREQASMFAQMGYDGMFFGRLDYQDKIRRLETKTMEMIWHASANLGESSDIFTGVLHNLYQPPPGFCFDILCSDEPMIDDADSPDYNVNKRVDKFFGFVNDQAKHYRTNNIIMTMGGDFTYMDANVYFKNMDKLIMYANQRQSNGSNINLFYSTPSCYLKALHDANITWPEKHDDFFPYGSDIHSYWTGYFTSRPTQKHYERVGNHFLQITKQMTSFALRLEDEFLPRLNALREVMGVMQHHDAITGTEKQHVAEDYARMMHKSIDAASQNTMAVLNQFVTRATNGSAENPFEFKICPQLNVSSCEISETSERFVVTVYNPLAHLVFEYVTIPVEGENYLVMDYRDVEIKHQIMTIPDTIQDLHFRESNSTHLLTFLAPEVPPIGFKSFYITKLRAENESTSDEGEKPTESESKLQDGKVTISNKYFNLTFDDNGMLESLITVKGDTHKLAHNFIYYNGAYGSNIKPENRSSGAYIFRPKGADHFVATKAEIEVIRGQHVQEVRQKFNDWISQIVRLYYEENYVEFEWMVGPIPIDDGVGKEVASRFYSTIQNDGVFYTDSNGREMIKRVLNHRDTWDLELEEQIAGNYYPVTARIAIEDKYTRMALLNDRAQGGSSLYNGSLELMVHRRLLKDDAFGVGEALNETEYGKGLIARGKHWLIIGKKDKSSPSLKAQERFLQNQKLLPCWYFFSNVSDLNYTTWMQKYSNIYSAMSLALPKNIHLLTFEPRLQNKVYGSSFLVRFEHILEINEDSEYAKNVTFNVQDHFRALFIDWIEETTLAGNQWLQYSNRLKFKADPKDNNVKHKRSADDEVEEHEVDVKSKGATPEDDLIVKTVAYDYKITLKPMQIRTFVFKLHPEIDDK